MQSWSLLVLSAVLTSGLGLQVRPDAPADATFYAISYVETRSSSIKEATEALRRYRDASRKANGSIRFDLFEQIGRPGHFVKVETWRDQQSFDNRDAAIQKQLLGALESIRISGYDQRPYKTLTAVSAQGSPDPQAIFVVSHVDIAPNSQGPPSGPLLTSLAEASRAEPGNVRFDVTQHMMRANHFTVVEVWADQQALDRHAAAAHTKQYRDDVQPGTGSPLDERAYRRVE